MQSHQKPPHIFSTHIWKSLCLDQGKHIYKPAAKSGPQEKKSTIHRSHALEKLSVQCCSTNKEISKMSHKVNIHISATETCNKWKHGTWKAYCNSELQTQSSDTSVNYQISHRALNTRTYMERNRNSKWCMLGAKGTQFHG